MDDLKAWCLPDIKKVVSKTKWKQWTTGEMVSLRERESWKLKMRVTTLAVAPSTCELLSVFCMGTLCSIAGVKEQFPSSVFSSKDSETGSVHMYRINSHRSWSHNSLWSLNSTCEIKKKKVMLSFTDFFYAQDNKILINYLHSVLRLISRPS